MSGKDIGVELNDIHATVDLGLDDVNARLDLGRMYAKADVDLTANAKMQADVGARGEIVAAIKELAPLFLNLVWKEIPLVKVAMPHNYKLSFRLFGLEIASIALSGGSEFVSEDNS